MATTFAAKRLQRELPKLENGPLPPGIALVSAPNFSEWHMDIRVLDPAHPLYANETYRLRFKFPQTYPIEAPEVMFIYVPPLSTASSDCSATSSATAAAAADPASSSSAGKSAHRPIPMHPHVYSNGIICLDLLDKAGWSPVQNVESVCMSLQSMLAGNYKDERPEGDELFVRTNRRAPKDVIFDFHDDKC